MRYYFDLRNEKSKIYVFFYVDDVYYGKICAEKNTITSVNLPNDAERIRISFSKVFSSIKLVKANTIVGEWSLAELRGEGVVSEPVSEYAEENEETKVVDSDLLEFEEHTEINFGYEDKKPIPEHASFEGRLQYPYDVEIDIRENSGDLVFYPVNFKRKELCGGIYYQGRSAETCDLIEMKLKKRIAVFDIETRRKLYLIVNALGALLFFVLFFRSLFNYLTVYWPNREIYNNIHTYYVFYRIGVIISYFVISSGFSTAFEEIRTYEGIFIEKDMKDEYIATKDGEVIDL